jgi:hypothetical protein
VWGVGAAFLSETGTTFTIGASGAGGTSCAGATFGGAAGVRAPTLDTM